MGRNLLKTMGKFTIMGNNANGIKNKLDSLQNNVAFLRPSVITIQETKLLSRGTIKLPGYQIYEKPRSEKLGGGLLTAIDENLDSVVTSEENDVEILTVQISIGNLQIRVVNAYGPQEDDELHNIQNFWLNIEQEISSAIDRNCMIIVQLDANAKVGNNITKQSTSRNGMILLDLLKRQNMHLANSLDQCKGIITRQRTTVVGVERSVLDYVLICDRMKEFLTSMLIDEDQNYVLTSYKSNNGKKKLVKSDHNIIFCTFSINYRSKKASVRREVFNLKNPDCQSAFKLETSKDKSLSNIFTLNNTFLHNANIFNHKLKGCLHKCFRKIRIVKGGRPKSSCTYNQILLRKKTELELFLKRCLCPDVEEKVHKDIDKLEICLSESMSKERFLKVKEHTKSMQLGGRFSQLQLWKLKQRLYPRPKDPPMAKRDNFGNLITTPGPLKVLYMKTYIHRLRSREMETNLIDVYFLKTELWASRLKELMRRKTSDWTFNDLRTAIKSLKSNKATDPSNMISELFKPSCMGEDLEKALLLLFNGMKSNMVVPDFIQHQNITSIYKKKGSRLEMKNERGIFILTTLKKILDKLIYQEKQDDIDRHMSDSNIGARKNKQVKDHLFIIHGVVNSVVNGKEDCIDIQIYDLEQAFDALWLEDCMLDLYDSLSEKNRDDKIALLYKSSEKNLVSINTPHGLTERGNIPTIVQQGGTWGPLLCSNSIDSIGRDLQINNNSCYLYKNSVRILPLGMVDDITAISKCGVNSLDLNTYINSKIELKKLRFHVPDKAGRTKCHKIHVGSNSSHTCPILKVHESEMKEVDEDEYLGDIVSRDGKNKQNIHKRISRGFGVISEILNIVNQITFGRYYYETALLLREALFLSSVLNNTEIMYNMTTAEMEEFDKLDRLLLKRLLHAPISTPTEALYLELGLVPASIHIKARRVKYLHYLFNKSHTEMLSMFFWTQ